MTSDGVITVPQFMHEISAVAPDSVQVGAISVTSFVGSSMRIAGTVPSTIVITSSSAVVKFLVRKS